ncbi:MAG: 6-bladed beta-propeller, partial [Muribaculaceae bacterium]|nr:6-bladed beta-propeller [Muribaculaceae bacterium]
AVAGAAMSVILLGCGSGDSGLPVMNLEADMNVENTQNPETVANFKIVVHPEVTDTTLINYLNLVDIIDGKFYVASNNLMVFGIDGKCLSSFNHVGPGPEEYGQWDGALVDRKSGDWIMTPSNMQPVLKRYTQYGAFAGADTILPMQNLQYLNDGWIATNNGLSCANLTLYYLDNDFNLIDSMATPFKHRVYAAPGGKTGLQSYVKSNGCQAYILRNDTVYDITDAQVAPAPVAVASFGDKIVPNNYDEELEQGWYDKYIEPYYYYGSDYVMVFYSHEGRVAMRVYNFKSGELVLALSNNVNADAPGLAIDYDGITLYAGMPMYVSDNTFYFSISDSQMIDLTGDENANPAIFAIEIK